MKLARLVVTALAIAGCAAGPARAQTVVVIPDNGTALCNDGTWSVAASQRGACSSHQGVKHWIGRRPRGAAARCNDGEYWTNATLQGACSSHGGVFKSYKAAAKAARKADKMEEKAEKKEMKADMKDAKAAKSPRAATKGAKAPA